MALKFKYKTLYIKKWDLYKEYKIEKKVSQIFCFITFSKNNRFKPSSKTKTMINNLFKQDKTKF